MAVILIKSSLFALKRTRIEFYVTFMVFSIEYDIRDMRMEGVRVTKKIFD